jgi:hypothetical protein
MESGEFDNVLSVQIMGATQSGFEGCGGVSFDFVEESCSKTLLAYS